VLAIFAIVATWRFTPPPRTLPSAETVYIHFHGERAMAQIDVTPQRRGGAHVALQVTDGALKPVDAKEVAIVLSNRAAGIEAMRSAAVKTGDGEWRIDDIRIPVPGIWRLRVEILISDFDKVMLEDGVELPRARRSACPGKVGPGFPNKDMRNKRQKSIRASPSALQRCNGTACGLPLTLW